MEETAQQLARQLRVEEEEEEEEAMVLVKLEELNRPTQTFDGPTQKLDHVPATAAAPKQTNAEKVFTESGKTNSSELEFNPSSVRSRADAKHVVQPSEEHSSPLYVKVSGGRVNSQLKSQHTRRMPRRMGDKFHSGDNFIWLPKTKPEVTYEVRDKTETAKSDDFVHNNLKSKEAEVEKYDPKLVSKELAQQTSLDGNVVGRGEPSQNIKTCQPRNSATGIEGSENKVDKPKSFGPGSGRSSYAKKRRAKKLGICYRCCLTTCNGEYGVCQGYVEEGGGDSDITISDVKSYVLYGLSNSERVGMQTEVETHAEEGRVPHDVQGEA